jgi:O-antigen/teichoic acid export membrane protein
MKTGLHRGRTPEILRLGGACHEFIIRVLVLLSGSVGAALLSFVTQLICARALHVADYGRLVALLAAVNIIGVFSGYGMGWFWLQLFGREGRAAFRWIDPTIRLLAIASMLGAGLLCFYVFLSGEDFASSSLVAALLIPVLFGQSLAETTAARLQLEERYAALGAWQSLSQFGRFVTSVALIISGLADFTNLLAGFAAVGFAVMAISLISLDQVRRRQIDLVGHGDDTSLLEACGRAPLLTTLVGATPYCFCTIFYLVYSQGVVVIVERTLGGEAAAMYNSAFLIISAVYLIPSVVYMKYLVGKIFRWWVHDREMFRAVVHVGVAAGALIGLVCMLAVVGIARFAIPLLFGSRYLGAVPILTLLALGIPVRFVQHAYGAAFFSEENMKRKVWYLGGGALTCLGLSAVLIPPFGVQGAALSAVFSEIALLVLFMRGAARHVDAFDLRSTFSIAGIRTALAYIERGREGTPTTEGAGAPLPVRSGGLAAQKQSARPI